MELFLIRHPEPDVPEGTCYGRSDIGLAEDAAVSAARLRGIVPAGIPVYTSPLLRCRSVAEQLSPAPAVDERLVEMHFGEWEMRRWDEIEKAAFDAWVADILHFAPPGGESAAAMLARTLAFLDELRRSEAPAARGEPRHPRRRAARAVRPLAGSAAAALAAPDLRVRRRQQGRPREKGYSGRVSKPQVK
jgi:alpha-ribazole phosphatase